MPPFIEGTLIILGAVTFVIIVINVVIKSLAFYKRKSQTRGLVKWIKKCNKDERFQLAAEGPYAGANPAWIKHVRETLPISWIPITEKAPADDEVCITYHEHTGVDIMRCRYLKGEDAQFGILMFVSRSGFLTDDVTHWIPLAKRIQEILKAAKYV